MTMGTIKEPFDCPMCQQPRHLGVFSANGAKICNECVSGAVLLLLDIRSEHAEKERYRLAAEQLQEARLSLRRKDHRIGELEAEVDKLRSEHVERQ